MIYISYAKNPNKRGSRELLEKVKTEFCHTENSDYLVSIMSRKSDNSRHESLCALLLLSKLAHKIGVDTSALVLMRRDGGKPYFKDSELKFSLSHSKGYVAAAISDIGDIGIDLECSEISCEKAHRLAARWFNESEKREFCEHPDRFLRIWTKKEAYSKMRGITLAESISSERLDEREALEKQNEAYFSFYEANGHPLTVCSEINEKCIFIADF